MEPEPSGRAASSLNYFQFLLICQQHMSLTDGSVYLVFCWQRFLESRVADSKVKLHNPLSMQVFWTLACSVSVPLPLAIMIGLSHVELSLSFFLRRF